MVISSLRVPRHSGMKSAALSSTLLIFPSLMAMPTRASVMLFAIDQLLSVEFSSQPPQ